MISASILFWLALPVPGFVLVRRFFREDLESGLMGTLAVSYLATLGLLSPVAIICYLARAPMWVFSAAIVLCFAGALVEISRRRWWGELGRLVVFGVCFEALIIALDMVIGARVGTFLNADAKVHLARVRFLLDRGFNNDDPFVAARCFFPIYHTNLLHALYAACSQLSRTEPIIVWFHSLPWGKLLISAGTYYMVWSVFERRWPAWAAALFVIGVRGPFTYLIYPNQLAPYFLTPMMVGFLVQAYRARAGWGSVVKLAVGSLVIGQFHGLYVLFCMMALGPVLAAAAIWNLLRRTPDRWRLAACTAALTAGFPFLIVSKLKTPAANVASSEQLGAIGEGGFFKRIGANWAVRNPTDLVQTLGGGVGNSIGWAVGLACALGGRQRRHAAVVAAILGSPLVILYVPPVCTFFLRHLGEEWILQRFDYLFGVCHAVLVPGAIAFVLDPGGPSGVVRALGSGLALIAGMVCAGHSPPDDWNTMYGTARDFSGLRHASVPGVFGLREFLQQHVPRGETILTDPVAGIDHVAVYDCHLIASERASNGVPDLSQRRRDLGVMLAPDTPWDRRRALLKKYNITFFIPNGTSLEWTMGHCEQFWERQGRLIIKLKLEP